MSRDVKSNSFVPNCSYFEAASPEEFRRLVCLLMFAHSTVSAQVTYILLKWRGGLAVHQRSRPLIIVSLGSHADIINQDCHLLSERRLWSPCRSTKHIVAVLNKEPFTVKLKGWDMTWFDGSPCLYPESSFRGQTFVGRRPQNDKCQRNSKHSV